MNVLSLRHVAALLSLSMTLCVCSGCQRAPAAMVPADLVQVQGQVLLDKKAITGVTVSFVPQQATTGQGAFGITDNSGRFSLIHYSQAEGVQPGTYGVIFSKLACKDGSPIPPGKDAADVGAIETLPPEVTTLDPTRQQYLVTIDGPRSDLSFDLKSSTKKRR